MNRGKDGDGKTRRLSESAYRWSMVCFCLSFRFLNPRFNFFARVKSIKLPHSNITLNFVITSEFAVKRTNHFESKKRYVKEVGFRVCTFLTILMHKGAPYLLNCEEVNGSRRVEVPFYFSMSFLFPLFSVFLRVPSHGSQFNWFTYCKVNFILTLGFHNDNEPVEGWPEQKDRNVISIQISWK